MSVIAKQSGLASIALGIGLMLGAANTMFVLPRAFEGNEAVWGLLRIMTSWGMICSSIFHAGRAARHFALSQAATLRPSVENT